MFPFLASIGSFLGSAGGAAALSAGTNIVGGIMQNRANRKAEGRAADRSARQIQTLVADAQAAGINPLTAIKAGGAPSHSGPAPILSSFDFLSDAVDSGMNVWSNAKQQKQDNEVRQLEMELLREQLRETRSKASAPFGQFGYNVQSITTGVRRDSTAGQLTGTQSVDGAGNPSGSPVDRAFEAAGEIAPVENVPLTFRYRSGVKNGSSWVGLNPDAWEVGIGELAGGAIIHGGGWVVDKASSFIERATQETTTAPKRTGGAGEAWQGLPTASPSSSNRRTPTVLTRKPRQYVPYPAPYRANGPWPM